MFENMKRKENELYKVRDELHEVRVKYSDITRLSHQDPGWSEAKAHNWAKDLEKLEEKELQALQELAEVKASDSFQKEMVAAESVLDRANKRLQVDLQKAEENIQMLRYEIAGRILEGVDPYKLAVEIKAAKDHVDTLKLSLDGISQAYNILVKIGEPVYVREKLETIRPHEIPTALGPREVPQYQN